MASIAFIRAFVMAQDEVVKFAYGATRCPVCEFCKLDPGTVLVRRTKGVVRYCECLQCGATFRAEGDEREKLDESGSVPEPLTPKRIPAYKESKSKPKKGKKNGNRRGTNSRTGAI